MLGMRRGSAEFASSGSVAISTRYLYARGTGVQRMRRGWPGYETGAPSAGARSVGGMPHSLRNDRASLQRPARLRLSIARTRQKYLPSDRARSMLANRFAVNTDVRRRPRTDDLKSSSAAIWNSYLTAPCTRAQANDGTDLTVAPCAGLSWRGALRLRSAAASA